MMLRKLLGSLALSAMFTWPAAAETLILKGDVDRAPQQGLIKAMAARAFGEVGIEAEIRLRPWSRASRADWIISHFNRGLEMLRAGGACDALLEEFGFGAAAAPAPR